jgi:transcriptional regulator with XRE-family HTH domain
MTPDDLRKARASMGLTQTQMAEKLGLSLAGYQNIETGEGGKDIREVYALAVSALLGMPPAASRGVKVQREPERALIGHMKEGDVFCLPAPPNGRVIGMIGGTEYERRVLVFGAPGTPHEEFGASWIAGGGGDLASDLALRISNPTIELARNAQGYAVPTEKPLNGAIVIDEAGARWIYIKTATAEFYRLTDGQQGIPARRREYFNNWRMIWTPEGAEQPVELLRNAERVPLLSPVVKLV